EIRRRFLAFFEKRGHKIIPSASLVPENDPSVLFNTAGMQPLVPYLLGQAHPMGSRIADIQKCVRTGDLDDIGDNRHFSFFEMMGNWSLGDYFKHEAIGWSYEFLTSKEEGLGLDSSRLYVTIFEGDENAPFDEESKQIWMNLGVPEHRIYALPADDNWWSPGDNGPCGPCSEMFYDMTEVGIGNLSKEAFLEAVKKEDVIEIWNDVFMEYEKKDGKVIGKLAQRNVDTGAGLERMTAVMQGKKTAYETDLFEEVIDFLKLKTSNENTEKERYIRIIADHIRTSLFLIADGVIPSNKDRGYILRRLIRRAGTRAQQLGLTTSDLVKISFMFGEQYGQESYPEVSNSNNNEILRLELSNFNTKLVEGLKKIDKLIEEKEKIEYADHSQHRTDFGSKSDDFSNLISGLEAFDLFQTHGFPPELLGEILAEKGMGYHKKEFEKAFKEHQEKSRTASAGMFKGGLANHNEKTIKLHTAHHLLLAGLQAIVNPEIKQRGSNITEERLRIDFVCDHKLTDEEKKKVEDWVNDKITQKLIVARREMPREEAEKIGAQMEFGAKYPDMVSVYVIEDENGNAISKEFCGGPHVSNTSELGHFKIQKEEAVAQGIRRVKAVLE
ncbi:MAG: alanine--tRNA ligase, partial [Candidatus Paceibacterota bacterium]